MFEYPYVEFFMLNDSERERLYHKVKDISIEDYRARHYIVRYDGKYKAVELSAKDRIILTTIFNQIR